MPVRASKSFLSNGPPKGPWDWHGTSPGHDDMKGPPPRNRFSNDYPLTVAVT